MKKYQILLLCIIISGSSCKKDFLNLAPEDQISGETFLKNETQFRQALYAAYNPLRIVGPDFYTGEMRTDNTHYEYNPGNRGTAIYMRENIADFVDDASNDYTKQIYTNCYTGIARANLVINNIQGNTTIEAGIKDDIEGQAKFLRAFYYFKLVRYFGDVPLYLKEVVKADDAFLPRSPKKEVYDLIISDVQTAIDKLGAIAKFPANGLATKGAATMLLADVYMTLKDYTHAEELLTELTQMNYGLLPNYADVFSTANKNSMESIFEVQFQQGLQNGMESNFIYIFLPRCYNTGLITYNVATNNTGTGGWNTPTKNLIQSYEPNDKRLDASIGIAEGSYDGSNYFTLSAYKSIVGYTPPADKVGVPFIKKYLNPHTDKNNTNDNWPVYRYADALLLLAEAKNELGKSGEALAPLNQVRARAGLEPIANTDQAALKDIILHERRIELAFENHRWFDLLRSGKAIQIMNAYGSALKQQYSYLLPVTYNVTENRLLYPIPQSEVDVNHLMVQNPGY